MAYANQEARLTVQQAKFVNAVIAGKTITEAYKVAGYKPSVANASRLSGIEKVQRQIRQGQMRAAAKAEHTAATIALELDEVRLLAIEDRQYAAAVAAILGKAKVLGLIVDRKEVEVLHRPALLPTKTLELSEDEWRDQFAKPLHRLAAEQQTPTSTPSQNAAAAGEAARAVALDVGIDQADLEASGLKALSDTPKRARVTPAVTPKRKR